MCSNNASIDIRMPPPPIKILRVVKTTITEELAEDFICESFVSLIVNEIYAFPFYF